MKYLKKAIENDSGHRNEAHAVTSIKLDLYKERNDPTEYVQTGRIELSHFRDKVAMNDKLTADNGERGPDIIEIPDLTQLACYETVMLEVLGIIASDPKYADAVVDDTNQ